MIEARNLTKTYGAVKAVDDMSFDVAKGEIVGFLGPNGAGKSTTLRILAGFLGATSGTVKVAGVDVAADPKRARAALGYMPENAPLYPELRVREYLQFRADLKGVPRKGVGRALEQAKVDDMADVVIGQLSKGYRQRVALADALLGDPPLLVLDEPTAGLDPNQIREVRDLLKGLAGPQTVLLSTHILPEVESTCTRAIVIAKGKLVSEGDLATLRSSQRSPGARLVVRGEGAHAVAKKVAGVKKASAEELGEGLFAVTLDWKSTAEEAAIEEVVAALAAAGHGVREVVPRRASLEQVFAELTGVEAP